MTQEEKKAFFALYWGQKVQGYQGTDKTYTIDRNFIEDFDKSFLYLKSLSNISDEDAIAIGYPDAKSATTTYYSVLGKSALESDYLRSKGYAISWRNYSVEDLIKEGVIKLI